MTVLEEMGVVIRAVPGPLASPVELARWYELKAHLLEHIAEDGADDAENVLCQANAAHRHAATLLEGSAR
jgi:hypothetical protein